MSVFSDAAGREWRIELDAFSMQDVMDEAKVDLADITAGGYAAIATDVKALVRVLVVLCRDEMKERDIEAKQFQKQIRKDAIASARDAVINAAADFFPLSEWSVIQSNLEKQQKGLEVRQETAMAQELWATIEPILPFLQTIQGMPDNDFKRGAMEEAKKQIIEAGGDISDLETLLNFASAGGQDATPSNSATDSQENAEPQPAG